MIFLLLAIEDKFGNSVKFLRNKTIDINKHMLYGELMRYVVKYCRRFYIHIVIIAKLFKKYFDLQYTLPEFRKCNICHVLNAKYVCGKCQNIWYCSKQCQKKSWEIHDHMLYCPLFAKSKITRKVFVRH